MSEQNEPNHHWWRSDRVHARRAAIGATALVASLALVVGVVWALPGAPVLATAGKVAEVVANPAAAALKAANAELSSKVTGLRREVKTRDAALAAAYDGDRGAAQEAVAAQSSGGTAPIATTPRGQGSPAGGGRPAAIPTPSVAPTAAPGAGGTAPHAAPTPAAPRPGPSAPSPSRSPTTAPVRPPAPTSAPVPVPTRTIRVTAAPAPAVTVTATPKPTTPTPKPTAAPTPAPAPLSLAAITAPTDRYFGLYTEQAPFNWGTYDDAVSKLATSSQTVGYFSGWDETFRANAVTRSWAHGLLPIMTWESRPIADANNVVDAPDYSLHRIIDGDFDDYLRTYARSIVTTGLPMGIRLDHEMNGTWYPWAEDDGHGRAINGNSAGEYVRMWRHVHDVFQQEGANGYVFWIWAPNRINKLTAAHRTEAYLRSLYPGDEYVDWVGLSGYLRPSYAKDDDFSFDFTFGPTLAQLRAVAPGKRILLAEIGASETGGHKVAWLASLFDALAKPENEDVVGVLWFDLAVSTYTEGVLGTNDWRVDSRPETLAAFRAGMARTDTGFGPLPSP